MIGANGQQFSEDVDRLLQALLEGKIDARLSAVTKLSLLAESNVFIVTALIATAKSDNSPFVRRKAFDALNVPIHQAVMEQCPELALRLDVFKAGQTRAAEARQAQQKKRTRTIKIAGGAFMIAAVLAILGLLAVQHFRRERSLCAQGFAQLNSTNGNFIDRVENARKTFEEGIKKNPSSADCQFGRGLSLYMEVDAGMGGDHAGRLYQAAVANFTKAVELDPTFGDAYYYRGIVEFSRLYQNEAAVADFTQALALDPEAHRSLYSRPSAYYWRGLAYKDAQRYPEALADFSKAIALDSGFNDAYMNRGLVYSLLNEHGEAIDDLSRVIRSEPGSFPHAYYHRAIEYAALDNYAKAIADMEVFIKPTAGFSAAAAAMIAQQYGFGAKEYQEGKQLLAAWKQLTP